ncbi:MAG: RluA family pseudouridine synthase, partial [Psittacicella sp.]
MEDNLIIDLNTSELDFGLRLDQFLARNLDTYSRTLIKGWIEKGLISINGKVINIPKYKLSINQYITGEVIFEKQLDSIAQKIDLNIVYEDDYIIVINKPKNLVVHPGAGNKHSTLLNALLYHDKNLEKLPRAGIVHRLDKDTTGIMVVAKTIESQIRLSEMIANKEIIREYNAIVLGRVISGGSVDEPISRDPRSRIKMATHPYGKPSLTHYRVVKAFRHSSLLRLRLDTGRTHQIRVHMS